MQYYIVEIKINNVRHLNNITINLGNDKNHLILTGKNGSGKTSVLEKLHFFISNKINNSGNIQNFYNYKDRLDTLDKVQHKALIDSVNQYIDCVPTFNNENIQDCSNFIYAFFDAKRKNETIPPKGINKIELSKNKTQKLNKNFLQYIVNLKAEKSFANDDGDKETVRKIDSWFKKFEKMLQQIFNDNNLKIKFDRKNYNFTIQRTNRKEFDFNTLSAGYSAVIDIITELILKIETTETKSFDCEGIVLIDEIENHLHVELQKNILPFLTTFFPNIQFIITTHSPFVLSSMANTVVYDLERKEQLSGKNLINASYTQIVKNYFEVDSEFSNILEQDIFRYEVLINKLDKTLSKEEQKELLELDMKLDKLAPMLSDVIYLKFKELQDKLIEND